MKKFIPVIVILLLLGVGGYFFLTQKGGTVPLTGQIQNKLNESGGNVISSIQDAILKATPLKCEYPDDKGNTMTTYIKGDKIRGTGYVSDSKSQGEFLMRDNKMYTWDTKTKKGVIIGFNNDVSTQGTKVTQSPDQKTSTVENLEKYKQYCKVAVISDSMFNIPTDVQFTDLEEQMKNSGIDTQKLIEESQATPPPDGQ